MSAQSPGNLPSSRPCSVCVALCEICSMRASVETYESYAGSGNTGSDVGRRAMPTAIMATVIAVRATVRARVEASIGTAPAAIRRHVQRRSEGFGARQGSATKIGVGVAIVMIEQNRRQNAGAPRSVAIPSMIPLGVSAVPSRFIVQSPLYISSATRNR